MNMQNTMNQKQKSWDLFVTVLMIALVVLVTTIFYQSLPPKDGIVTTSYNILRLIIATAATGFIWLFLISPLIHALDHAVQKRWLKTYYFEEQNGEIQLRGTVSALHMNEASRELDRLQTARNVYPLKK